MILASIFHTANHIAYLYCRSIQASMLFQRSMLSLVGITDLTVRSIYILHRLLYGGASMVCLLFVSEDSGVISGHNSIFRSEVAEACATKVLCNVIKFNDGVAG